MANAISKILTPKKTKLFWMYFVVGVLLIILGVIFMPIWSGWAECPWKDWGNKFVNLCIAATILVYLFTYLINQIKRGGSGVVMALTIVEFVVMLLIAVGCICSVIPKVNFGLGERQACKIAGIAIWCRGAVEIFRSYYKKNSYPVYFLICSVLLVTLGTIMIHKPFFDNQVILWIFVILFIVFGILYIAFGFLCKPKKK